MNRMRAFLMLALCFSSTIFCHDVLVEFKTAYFLFQDSRLKEIYGRGGVLFGPEITAQVCNNWYGFVSADFLSKKGNSIGLCNATTLNLIPLALGVKYFFPFCYGDVYAGIGFTPTHLKTKNCSPFISKTTAKWGYGAIAKVGTYISLPNNIFIDLFIDYTAAKIGSDVCESCIIPLSVTIKGAIIGGGIGYRF